MNFNWTREAEQDIERLWTGGMSAGQIVKALGSTRTRSSILGKLARMGLQRTPVPDEILDARAATKAAREAERRAANPKPVKVRPMEASELSRPRKRETQLNYNFTKALRRGESNFLKINIDRKRARKPLELPRELDPAEIPASQRRTIYTLAEADCRWPYGDPGTSDFFFCGSPQADGVDFCGPYCAKHMRMAVQR